EQAERLARAVREAGNAARLRDHPGIVAVHDVVVEDGIPWMVMQLVRGQSLAEHVEAHGPLPADQAAVLARSLLQALAAVHEAGMVHRDIKPANVLLTEDGRFLLTDFGIAKHHADTALTATDSVIGSVEYLAPERAQGQDGLPASDLFSLGVTLYQAVEGVSPFRRDTSAESLSAVLFGEVAPPQRAGRLAPLIMGLLAKDPEKRMTTGQALTLLDLPEPATGQTVAMTAVQHNPVPQGFVPGMGVGPFAPRPWQPSSGTAMAAGVLGLSCACLALFGVYPDFAVLLTGRASYPLLLVLHLMPSLAEAVLLGIGASLLLAGRSAGRVLLSVGGGLVIAQVLITVVTVLQLYKGHHIWRMEGAFVYLAVGPLAAILAIAVLILALVPATAQWCARQSQLKGLLLS
ncbi:serine/threonine protein kinase, partial [Amycolatopsis rhizosphaerae]